MVRRNFQRNISQNVFNRLRGPMFGPRQQRNSGVSLAMRELRSSTTRVNGPFDPPSVTNDVIVTKIVQITHAVAAGTAITVTPKIIAAGFPGGFGGVFGLFRLVKISLYGSVEFDNVGMTVDKFFDGAQFSDVGVPGQSRPTLHISPTFSTRQVWLASGDATQVLYRIQGLATGEIVAHYTVEMRTQLPA
jgi:hypothetical protein